MSGFKREPKNPKKVSHGGSVSGTRVVQPTRKARKGYSYDFEKLRQPSRYSLGEIASMEVTLNDHERKAIGWLLHILARHHTGGGEDLIGALLYHGGFWFLPGATTPCEDDIRGLHRVARNEEALVALANKFTLGFEDPESEYNSLRRSWGEALHLARTQSNTEPQTPDPNDQGPSVASDG